MRAPVRNGAARMFRTLPRFRGKGPLGLKLARLLTDPRSDSGCVVMVRMRDGSQMRLDVRSRTEAYAVWTGEYNPKTVALLGSFLQPGCVVLDIGANVGFYSVPLGLTARTLSGRLYAFEPVHSNAARLQENIALNGLAQTVEVVESALGERDGAIELIVELTDGAKTGNAVLSEAHPDGPTSPQSARITTLSEAMNLRGIPCCDLIKIDVEGAEFMALAGGRSFIEQTRPIIFGEFNPYWMGRFGKSFLDVVDLLASCRYQYFREVRDGAFVPVEKPAPNDENVLMLPREERPDAWAVLRRHCKAAP